MYIKKIAEPKDAVRISREQDIPEFLQSTIHIEGNEIVCLAAEGYNRSPLGSVIGFDRKAPTETGFGAWPLGEHSFVERDGVFYPAPEIRQAEPVLPDQLPSICDTHLSNIHKNEAGNWVFESKYGPQEAIPGRSLFVLSPNGSLNVLTEGTTSYDGYMVCDKNGKELYALKDVSLENNRNIKILLAPTLELAETVKANATVEAEYGAACVSGSVITLAHHGERASNPAPCNWPNVPILKDGSTILVSHIDLDTLGGIQALLGTKIEDPEFWKAAEFIDVNGSHHIHELSQDVQDKLNAYYAYNETQPRERYTEIMDVTEAVMKASNAIDIILDENHPNHDAMIQAGIDWEQETTAAVEQCLHEESDLVRVFDSTGVFCAASYYSPSLDAIVPATVTFNEKFKSVTIAFADGGQMLDACAIVQKLWGPEAGGRAGIAGSPRGKEMTLNDALDAADMIEQEFERLQSVPTTEDVSDSFDNFDPGDED